MCTTAPVCFLLPPPELSGRQEGWQSAPRVEGSPATGLPGGHVRKNTPAGWRRSRPVDTDCGDETAPRRYRHKSECYLSFCWPNTTQMHTNLCKYLHHLRLVRRPNLEKFSPPLFGINQEESFLLGCPLPLQRLLDEGKKKWCFFHNDALLTNSDSHNLQWWFTELTVAFYSAWINRGWRDPQCSDLCADDISAQRLCERRVQFQTDSQNTSWDFTFTSWRHKPTHNLKMTFGNISLQPCDSSTTGALLIYSSIASLPLITRSRKRQENINQMCITT